MHTLWKGVQVQNRFKVAREITQRREDEVQQVRIVCAEHFVVYLLVALLNVLWSVCSEFSNFPVRVYFLSKLSKNLKILKKKVPTAQADTLNAENE